MSDLSKEVVSQEDNNNKVEKNFESSMKKLVAIIGGEKNLFASKKVNKDVMKIIVDELLSERKKVAEEEIKSDVIKLLDGHVALTKAISEKKKELIKLEQDKKKEFNEAASKVFAKIDSIEVLSSEYYSSLSATVEAKKQ